MTKKEDWREIRNDASTRLERLECLVLDFKKAVAQSQTEKHQLSETAVNTITITPDMNEAEIQLRIDMAKDNRAERHRQEVLEKASRYMSGVENRPVHHWCTQPSLATLKTQLEQKPPRYIKKYVEELRNKIVRYNRFDELFSQKILETLPCNWNQFYRTKEQGIAERKERDSYKLKAVNEAIVYMEEMLNAANEILEKKRAFIKEHAREIPSLVKQCNNLTRKASRLQNQIIELLRKASRGLKEEEKQKLMALILKHKELEQKHNAASAKLAAYSPDNPTAGLPSFPSANYTLPSWLDIKLRDAERR